MHFKITIITNMVTIASIIIKVKIIEKIITNLNSNYFIAAHFNIIVIID